MKSGIIFALLGAFLFGMSAPLIKLIITGNFSLIFIAGILYFSSGIGMYLVFLLRKFFGKKPEYVRMIKSDRIWLVLATLCGGLIAPVLMVMGIKLISAAGASLLLSTESAFTALLAWFVFKEKFSSRILLSMILIVVGGMMLSFNEFSGGVISLGALLIIGSCFFWGLDNNFTRKISASDPVIIATFKGLVAGSINLIIGYLLISEIPNLSDIIKLSIMGFLGYGLSMVFLIRALNLLGAARAGAYFGTAPFIGAFISILIFSDNVTMNFIAAAILMGAGVWICATEKNNSE